MAPTIAASVADARDEAGGVGAGRGGPERARGEDGERGGGADAQGPRGAEGRVDDHGHERRVEPDLDGQSGDGRVGHGLGDDHGGGGQARQHVRFQPGPLVPRDPGGGRDHGSPHGGTLLRAAAIRLSGNRKRPIRHGGERCTRQGRFSAGSSGCATRPRRAASSCAPSSTGIATSSPSAVSDDGETSTFALEARRPFLYFKPCLKTDDGTRAGRSGPNMLAAHDDRGHARRVPATSKAPRPGSFSPVIERDSAILGRKHLVRVYLPARLRREHAAALPGALHAGRQEPVLPRGGVPRPRVGRRTRPSTSSTP